jgi:hypothetical protein
MDNHQQSEKIKSQDDVRLEDKTIQGISPDGNTLLVSAFATYSQRQIVRKFWRLYLIGLAASLGGMYGGYCLSAAGNIVANPG